MTSKTTILFLAANAKDTASLRLDAEVRTIEEKIRLSPKANSFELISQWAVRPGDVMQILMRYRPDVLHFSGHATHQDEIILEDDRGDSKPVAIARLLDMFSAFKSSIRLVMLNACYSGTCVDVSLQGIDYIVGTNAAVGDKAATEFAGAFYQALAFSYSVPAAFELAKRQITLQGLVGANIFNLHVREGTDSSEPFLKGRAKRKRESTTTVYPVAPKNKRDKTKAVLPLELPISQVDAGTIDDSIIINLPSIGEHLDGMTATRSSSVPIEIQESLQ